MLNHCDGCRAVGFRRAVLKPDVQVYYPLYVCQFLAKGMNLGGAEVGLASNTMVKTGY